MLKLGLGVRGGSSTAAVEEVRVGGGGEGTSSVRWVGG
jgi:hypothetical protein